MLYGTSPTKAGSWLPDHVYLQGVWGGAIHTICIKMLVVPSTDSNITPTMMTSCGLLPI